ncbi:serine/threonine-protein kinase [Streptomyces sp. NPDC046831]|uniref:serine/threonine-protein kinase n=1 Tax=Streptomyces sp. NPDC046831 TaxID=3154805 RepID=UPI0033D08E7E
MAPGRNSGAGAEAELPEYAGHYRLESCLGSGGMGVVHLARSTSGLRLAVKVVHAEFARDPEFRGRFRQEVAAARRVSGAFTAPVVDADPDAARPWMATVYIPGPTLSDQVKRNGPMAPAQVRRLMAGLAEGLRDIHRVGVVHRDLKPSNVLLAEDGPKVIDFGISRPKDSELRTETGKLIGTPPFMAPEQFRRPREVGPAADIFALGSVLVHAATGRGPFDSDSPYIVAYQVVHDEPDLTGLPENLAPLVLRCLAKDPGDRPTPDELMRALRSVSASYDTQAFLPAQRTDGDPADEGPGGDGPAGEGPGGGRPDGDGRADHGPADVDPAVDPADKGRTYDGRPAGDWSNGDWLDGNWADSDRPYDDWSGDGRTHNGRAHDGWSGDGRAHDDRTDDGRQAHDSRAHDDGKAHGHRTGAEQTDDGRIGGARAAHGAPAAQGARAAGSARATGGARDAESAQDVAGAAEGARTAESATAAAPAGGDTPPPGSRDGRTGPRPGRGRRRQAALAAGALGLLVSGALVSAQLFQPASTHSPAHSAAAGASAAFTGWRAEPVSPGEGVPQCSHGAGRLICARPGLVYALDPADGELLWRHSVAETVRSTPPVVAGGLVQPLTEHGRRLEALDPATGEVRWHRTVPAYSGLRSVGGMLLLTGADGVVRALDGATGGTRWSRNVPGHTAPYFSSFAGDPLAYAVSTSDDGSVTRVTAVDADTGGVRWEARLDGMLTPAGSDGGSLVLLAGHPSAYGQVDAVVRYSPSSRASVRVPLAFPLDGVQASVRGGTVHLLATGGTLAAVDLGERKVRWQLETSVSRGSAPVADAGHVYFTAGDGRLLGVDAATGRLMGQTPPRLGTRTDVVAASLPQPVVADGHVYAGAPDGTVFAVDGRDPSAW